MAQTTLRDYLQSTEDVLSSGRIDQALANCQYILSYFPDSLEAQRLIGEAHLKQGHLEEAQQTFDWILTNDPENVVAYCDRALISERMSDIDTALDCYQQAYELSRGNGHIRQQFNQLSSQNEQQGFMFSRAGLARLYMRGDLLPQAIQEWEAVLTASPDRLDARIGLLETYWREGLYEQGQQLATQILDDVPGCLKALLLLAHITSAQNIHQAQELLQRAEALDPELVMAQELFSDLIASQPNDPFLLLLKKEPIVLPETANGHTTAGISENASAAATSTATFSDSLLGWSSLDTLPEPQQEYQPLQEAPKPWQPQQEIDSDFDAVLAHDQSLLEQQPWYQSSEASSEPVESWSSVSNIAPIKSVDVWGTEAREETIPAPPAWLDMLTKGERHQPSEAPPTLSTPPAVEQNPPLVLPHTEVPPATQPSWEEQLSAEPPTSPQEQEAEAPFFFGPEWLKSLGATTIESTPTIEAAAPTPIVTPEPQPQAPAKPYQEVKSPDKTEQNLLTTLEDLEHDLRSQGFVPLEPGALSTLAQEPTLSSALAQLGNLASQTTNLVNPRPPASPATTPTDQPAEQLWSAPPGPVFSPAPAPSTRMEPEPTFMLPTDTNVSSSPGALPSPSSMPSTGADASLDYELETTMKHPAVRLQAMQQRSPSQQSSIAFTGKGRLGTNKAADSNLTYKDRLLKGYQYQLAGAYDDAMQEYRIIIRSAPELLGEVVSNMRALLKLAPKYSAGYRVLGDAYMRQGEYLQAMEAYNKALTMAKKAKGQGG